MPAVVVRLDRSRRGTRCTWQEALYDLGPYAGILDPAEFKDRRLIADACPRRIPALSEVVETIGAFTFRPSQ